MAFTRPSKAFNPSFTESLFETLRLFPVLAERDRVHIVLLGLLRAVQKHALNGRCTEQDILMCSRLAAESLVDLRWLRPPCPASIAFDLRTQATWRLMADFDAWSKQVSDAWDRWVVGEPVEEQWLTIFALREPIFKKASPRSPHQMRGAGRYALASLKEPRRDERDDVRALREAHHYLHHEMSPPVPGIFVEGKRVLIGKHQIRDAVERVRDLPRRRRRDRDEQQPVGERPLPGHLIEGDDPIAVLKSHEARDVADVVSVLDEVEAARRYLEERRREVGSGTNRALVVEHLLRVTHGSAETLADVANSTGRANSGLSKDLQDERRRLEKAFQDS